MRRANFVNEMLVTILFPLMTHGEHRDGFSIVNLEQGDVSGVTKGDDEFTQKRGIRVGLATGEGHVAESFPSLRNRHKRRICGGDIPLRQKAVQPHDVIPRSLGKQHPAGHELQTRLRLADSTTSRSESITSFTV